MAVAGCSLLLYTMMSVTLPHSPAPYGDCTSQSYCCGFDENNDIRYHLFNRDTPENGTILPTGNLTDLRRAIADNVLPHRRDLPVIVYVHGFLDFVYQDAGKAIADAYVLKDDYNVILVEWTKLATFPWYLTAVRNVVLVGKHVAKTMEKLDHAGLPIDRIHMIGFSLGAHVVGFAGKSLRYPNGSPKLTRMTGLDPAQPLYYYATSNQRLDKRDAVFVDVIHTDQSFIGYVTPVGHADFYPNGGKGGQAGCQIQNLLNMGVEDLYGLLACSHRRSWMIYTESILNPRAFPASKCVAQFFGRPKCSGYVDNYLGVDVIPDKGIFYLETNEKPPFGRYAVVK